MRPLNISRSIKRIKNQYRLNRALKELELRPYSREIIQTNHHNLPKPLVVSLTSYSARFGTLELTLRSILNQTIQPDKVILWISHDDYPSIPQNLHKLENDTFEIRTYKDIKSYKKIIPTINYYKDCFILTFDDDTYYWADCIKQLVDGYIISPNGILCHRAHKIKLTDIDLPDDYVKWQFNIKYPSRSQLIFPTGVLGVLYEPGVFHEDTCNESIFTELCPTADDVWLFWMWRMNNHCAKKIGGKQRLIEWPNSQITRLRTINVPGNGNDQSIRNLIKRYGFPKSSNI